MVSASRSALALHQPCVRIARPFRRADRLVTHITPPRTEDDMQASESLEYDARCFAAYERARKRTRELVEERHGLKRDIEHMEYALSRRHDTAARLSTWRETSLMLVDDDAFAYAGVALAHASETPSVLMGDLIRSVDDACVREERMVRDLVAELDAHERCLRVTECKLALADAQTRTLCEFYTFDARPASPDAAHDDDTAADVARSAETAEEASDDKTRSPFECPFVTDARVRHGASDRKGVVTEGPDRVHGQMFVLFDDDWKSEAVHACDCFPLPATKTEPVMVWKGVQSGLRGLALAVDKEHVVISAFTYTFGAADGMMLYRVDADHCVRMSAEQPA